MAIRRALVGEIRPDAAGACAASTPYEIGDKTLRRDTWRYVAIRGDVMRCVPLTCLVHPELSLTCRSTDVQASRPGLA